MQFLKQSTSVSVKIGPFVDDTDGKTAETGLTLSQADIRLSKNGGDFAQKNDSGAATTDELGYYDCPLNDTDTGTLGRLVLAVHEAGALPVWHEFMVMPANVWDSLFGADKLAVDVEEIGAGIITATAIATDAIDADAIKADAVAEIQSGLATASALSTLEGKVDTVDGVVDAIKAKTDNLPASPAAVGSEMTLADGAITAAKVATDAIDADAIKADAVAEIQSGLATASALSTLEGKVDTVDTVADAIKAKTDNLPAAPAAEGTVDAVGTLLADVGAAVLGIDGVVDAVKAKTDNLPASPAAVGSEMTLADGAITAAKFAADAISAAALSAAAVAAIQAGLSTLDAAGVRTALGMAAANLDTQLAALLARVEADLYVDTTGSPWVLEFRSKGTAEALFKKALYQSDGSAVASVDHLIARQTHTA